MPGMICPVVAYAPIAATIPIMASSPLSLSFCSLNPIFNLLSLIFVISHITMLVQKFLFFSIRRDRRRTYQ